MRTPCVSVRISVRVFTSTPPASATLTVGRVVCLCEGGSSDSENRPRDGDEPHRGVGGAVNESGEVVRIRDIHVAVPTCTTVFCSNIAQCVPSHASKLVGSCRCWLGAWCESAIEDTLNTLTIRLHILSRRTNVFYVHPANSKERR